LVSEGHHAEVVHCEDAYRFVVLAEERQRPMCRVGRLDFSGKTAQ
jgi:hypothetical protein